MALNLLFLMALILPFQGSASADFSQSESLTNPLPACPDSPNCTRHSENFNTSIDTLFSAVKKVFEQIDPHEYIVKENEYSINAVFRIPIFGFKDDVEILLKPDGDNSVLHIRSASRVGHSDLGVNRRRVQKILTDIKTNL